ncbi:histidine kinase dimerization/phosphoacceptor domain-containing protein [Streptomyces sp. NPDC020490]|uniref:histidine kinase dimerization/phosphoacceptor domain-containing protein n=1 Tax=Streptomyces sp. NPDC020490 TaxID=3365078 RepID=UPI00379EF1F8
MLYAAACDAGLLRRRTRRARAAAELLLKRAESERHRTPAAERRRMERELHDVSAHHLTAVVVTAGAALGLRERRPGLVREALDFAVETGRKVTRPLGAVRAPAPSHEDGPRRVQGVRPVTGTASGRSLPRRPHDAFGVVGLVHLLGCAALLLGWAAPLVWAFAVSVTDDSGESMTAVIPFLATAPASLVLLVLPDGAAMLVAAVVFGALVNAAVIGWCARALSRGDRPGSAP